MFQLAIFVLFNSFLLHAFTFDLGYAAELKVRIPKNVRPFEADTTSSNRIASTLQKLSKNVILDTTRGERDIAVFQKAAPAVVLVLAGKDSIGSGAIISRDGNVITNWHVVGSSPRAAVFLKPKDST